MERSGDQSRKDTERRFHNDRFDGGHDIREPLNKWYAAVVGSLRLQVELIKRHGKGATVLEYGCADGRFSLGDERIAPYENRLAHDTAHFYGIDISDEAISRARDTAASQGLTNCNFTVMDAEHLTFPDGMFDLVFGQGIIHHLDIAKSFTEIARVLRPGGIAVFAEPMGHNPALNLFRKHTPELRTPDEHPLLMRDIRVARTVFRKVDTRFFGMTTLAAVPFLKSPIGPGLMTCCERLDRAILRIPLIQQNAWYVHLTLTK
jgi:SAM-dependent methyltransferase